MTINHRHHACTLAWTLQAGWLGLNPTGKLLSDVAYPLIGFPHQQNTLPPNQVGVFNSSCHGLGSLGLPTWS